MKNKILSIAIASAISALSCTNVLAAGNVITSTQTNSTGSVTAKQGENTATSDSIIIIMQKDTDNTSSILIEQDGATEVTAEVNQYKGVGSSIVIKQSVGGAGTPNSVKVTQGEDGAAASNTGNMLTIDTQGGVSNKVSNYSDVDDGAQLGFGLQQGVTNTATLNQHGTGNMLGFKQNGTDNVVTLTQDAATAASNMNISQMGDTNKVTASQAGVNSSDINVDIIGNTNNMGDVTHKIDQLADDSSIRISIDGDGNTVNASQTATASTSTMALTQSGNTNDADLTQSAATNGLTLTQTGDSNAGTLLQSGAGNTMTSIQTGNSNTSTLTQSGATNVMALTQNNDSNMATLVQSGGAGIDTMTVTQGGGSTATLTQF